MAFSVIFCYGKLLSQSAVLDFCLRIM